MTEQHFATDLPDVNTPTNYENPELERMRVLVADARARLAELESEYTKEKTRVGVMQATLFQRLKDHYQRRDSLRLIVDYRRKYLDSLLRGDVDSAAQAHNEYKKSREQTDKDYEETAAAMSAKRRLNSDVEAELTRLWKKLVKLYHPDKFAQQPDKLDTYHKLTAAINRAKDAGDIETLREIAENPDGFIGRQGWASLDFADEAEITQLRRLLESLQLEITNVSESLNQLRISPDFELCLVTEKNLATFEKVVTEQAKVLEKEIAELEEQGRKLDGEITGLQGKAAPQFR